MLAYPVGAGHSEEAEWRRDRPAPQTSDGKTLEFVQFYLNDFDCPEIIPSAGLGGASGHYMIQTHVRQRDAYRRIYRHSRSTANSDGLHILFLLSSPSSLLGRLAR